jgi:hypothetical protein
MPHRQKKCTPVKVLPKREHMRQGVLVAKKKQATAVNNSIEKKISEP